MARLQDYYKNTIVTEMMKQFSLTNRMAVPRLQKICVNMGVGKATGNRKFLDDAVKHMTQITGQMPVVTKARKSVSGFKLREGMAVGCMVTLRGKRMYEFLDRLISVALPRIRDFRGVPPNAFDGHGNYSLGISEQVVFPEIDLDDVETIQGMHITICMSGKSDEMSHGLLKMFGMPFAES
ncbi:MAG TPA: 50S ribosomal protein L5 [Candidatus Brocadiia bacterium]|nr:50S ribosomal protein L5 [Candidatus Brocadiia bacterium]